MNARKLLIVIARAVLTVALLIGVYFETGPWTTLFAALTAIGLELAAMER